jgi:glycerol-3-phosphate acyltransferase PlsY
VPPLDIALVTLAGYLLGSISFAVIVARAKGVDIFKEGSGNPGATNVKRTLGAKLGNTVFVLDALKGFAAAGWPLLAYGDGLKLGIIGLVAAILGHSFSVFLRFRGGKGVATTMGGLLALMPGVLLAGLAVWLLVFFLAGRIVALASLAFALSLPAGAALIHGSSGPRFLFAALLGLLIILRHRSNIARLLQGKENTFRK